jgi:hypothetical protein
VLKPSASKPSRRTRILPTSPNWKVWARSVFQRYCVSEAAGWAATESQGSHRMSVWRALGVDGVVYIRDPPSARYRVSRFRIYS